MDKNKTNEWLSYIFIQLTVIIGILSFIAVEMVRHRQSSLQEVG